MKKIHKLNFALLGLSLITSSVALHGQSCDYCPLPYQCMQVIDCYCQCPGHEYATDWCNPALNPIRGITAHTCLRTAEEYSRVNMHCTTRNPRGVCSTPDPDKH